MYMLHAFHVNNIVDFRTESLFASKVRSTMTERGGILQADALYDRSVSQSQCNGPA